MFTCRYGCGDRRRSQQRTLSRTVFASPLTGGCVCGYARDPGAPQRLTRCLVGGMCIDMGMKAVYSDFYVPVWPW